MPVSSNALRRFYIYDQCLSMGTKGYTMEDILDELRKEETREIRKGSRGEAREGIEIRKRQFQKDLRTIEEVWKLKIERIKIPGKKTVYRYKDPGFTIFSYDNLPKENNLLKLRDTLFLLQQFNGLPHFEFLKDLLREDSIDDGSIKQSIIVDFDSNDDLVGLRDFFSKLVIAIQLRKVLKIKYNASFKKHKEIVLSPYFLKEYNNRWFLLGNEKPYTSVSSLALDRIAEMTYVPEEEYTETDIDFKNDYFADVIGVTIPKGARLVNVVLKFSKERFPYIETKPLHGSQRILKDERAERIVRLKVIENNELKSLIMYYGSDVEVLEPESLRNAIKEKIASIYNTYH
jgi:hypothetical protein